MTSATLQTQGGPFVTPQLSGKPNRWDNALVRTLMCVAVLLATCSLSGLARAKGSCIPRAACCRICDKGKACGDACISRAFTCQKGRGCACDSAELCPDSAEGTGSSERSGR
jgi:hypothetical protein